MARALSGLAAALLLVVAAPAAAGAWRAGPGAGELAFTALQAGARFKGNFRRYGVELELDPAAPQQGRLAVTVATASADTLDAERDAVLHGRDFFWSARHPEARYEARGFRRAGEDWIADGELTLRGVTRPVAVRFTLQPAGNGARMRGTASVSRLAFGVGQGDWASTQWLGDLVEISFDLRLAAAAP